MPSSRFSSAQGEGEMGACSVDPRLSRQDSLKKDSNSSSVFGEDEAGDLTSNLNPRRDIHLLTDGNLSTETTNKEKQKKDLSWKRRFQTNVIVKRFFVFGGKGCSSDDRSFRSSQKVEFDSFELSFFV